MAIITKFAKFFMPAGTSYVKYIPYLFIIPVIVFQALSLTGCVSTSPGIPNIYIVSLRANNNGSATSPVQVRIGYFGICGIDEDGTRCMSATGHSIESITPIIFPSLASNGADSNSTAAPKEITDLITTAHELREGTFNSIPVASSILFVFGIVALLLHKRDIKTGNYWDKVRRSTYVKRATYGTLFLSAAGTFAAAMATTQAAGALEFTSAAMENASVLIKSGTTLQVFQWIAFGFSLTFALAVPFLADRKAGEQPHQEEFKEQV